MSMTVMIAAHKPYWMPDDPLYLPVQVGSAGKREMGWQRDDEGDNISAKNQTFCELTGHYWLWKHVDAEIYGLCHYRRYFAAGRPLRAKKERVLRTEQAQKLMEHAEVVVPHKRHYWIETNYSQYAHAHHEADLTLTRAIIAERCPAYLPAWERVMARRSGHRFNMFLMRKPQFMAYSAWLFDILFELERRLDISAYSNQDRRVFGYVGERLMDVWLEVRRPVIRECRVVNLERQHWARKIASFLKRKAKG